MHAHIEVGLIALHVSLLRLKWLAGYNIFEDKKTPARAIGEAKRDEQLEHEYTLITVHTRALPHCIAPHSRHLSQSMHALYLTALHRTQDTYHRVCTCFSSLHCTALKTLITEHACALPLSLHCIALKTLITEHACALPDSVLQCTCNEQMFAPTMSYITLVILY